MLFQIKIAVHPAEDHRFRDRAFFWPEPEVDVHHGIARLPGRKYRSQHAPGGCPPGGTHDVTGPEALSLGDVARRFSALTGRRLRYQPESVKSARDRLGKREPAWWRVDLSVGWFEAIAAGELEHTSDAVFRFTGKEPLKLEEYFTLFPELLKPLRRAQDQDPRS